jgi:uncharacterized protein (DUF305 family)
MTKRRRTLFLTTQLAVGLFLAVALGACGNDDSGSGSTAGNGIDRAFVADMIPHHESAVEMARVAERRSQSTFVRRLARDIISSQNSEITTMKSIASQLDAAGVKPKSLGLAEHEMGMDTDMSKLESAKPFDRAFIDMMVPHHQGAIRMARVELAKGSNAEAKQLAKDIVAAQAREINAMNEHRNAEFGAPSPAGGVPADDAKEDGAMPGMDHG